MVSIYRWPSRGAVRASGFPSPCLLLLSHTSLSFFNGPCSVPFLSLFSRWSSSSRYARRPSAAAAAVQRQLLLPSGARGETKARQLPIADDGGWCFSLDRRRKFSPSPPLAFQRAVCWTFLFDWNSNRWDLCLCLRGLHQARSESERRLAGKISRHLFFFGRRRRRCSLAESLRRLQAASAP